ncbi:hypothetical protein [Roseibacillus persicicus]|uniref:hypothetical protein n=1 Tax=Roseibacillus persicicus TaxID=454148 RepID=UPI002810769D|nr:hypothetical protein [Roseibacillus persicicus]MDQ8189338.1 hypothetical protein [Roseibacillus persicicus]
MKISLLLLPVLLFSPSLQAIPNSVFGGIANVESPFNGRDLTEPLIAAAAGGVGELPGEWQDEASVPGTRSAYLLARPKVFGQEALLVRGLWRKEKLEEIQITFNDAGSYFGYFSEEAPENLSARAKVDFLREKMALRQQEFAELHEKSYQSIREQLEQRGTGRTREIRFGKSRSIRAEVEQFEWDGVTARLFHGKDRLVRVSLSSSESLPETWMDREVAELDSRAYSNWLRDRVEKKQNGDLLLSELAVVPQGYRPYCGLNTLVMSGRYLGLHLDEDWLACAGQFQNTGSAAGSQMLSLYNSVASEAGLKMKRLNRFDTAMVKRSLREGLPVIVWRRWDRERDQLHSSITRQVASGAEADWGPIEPSALPTEKAPLHASVIVGFNDEREEFLFLESWAGLETPRRMLVRELDSTAYLTFCFQK